MRQPNLGRVGIRIVTFEACSGFTHVTARWIAQPPKAAFVTRLGPPSCPTEPLVSYQINRQLSGWNLPPLVIFRLQVAPKSDGVWRAVSGCVRMARRSRKSIKGRRLTVPIRPDFVRPPCARKALVTPQPIWPGAARGVRAATKSMSERAEGTGWRRLLPQGCPDLFRQRPGFRRPCVRALDRLTDADGRQRRQSLPIVRIFRPMRINALGQDRDRQTRLHHRVRSPKRLADPSARRECRRRRAPSSRPAASRQLGLDSAIGSGPHLMGAGIGADHPAQRLIAQRFLPLTASETMATSSSPLATCSAIVLELSHSTESSTGDGAGKPR